MKKIVVRKKKSLVRSLGFGAAVLLGMIVYAYGFNITKVNFETTRSERRLTQLTRILRALAHPALFEYQKEELVVAAPIYLPCPKSGVPTFDPDRSQPYLVLTPACGGAKEIIQVEGFSFWPNTKGPINFVPPSGASLTIGNLTTDADGYFSARVELPQRRPVDEAQTLRAIARRNIGAPMFSPVAHSTWEKIVETVFLALLATTLGTLLAIPVSFFAARNLMSTQESPLTSVALSVLGWPLGILIGVQAVRWIRAVGAQILDSNALGAGGWGSLIGLLVTWVVVRWAFPRQQTQAPGRALRLARTLALVAGGLAALFAMHMVASLALTVGRALVEPLGVFGFLGNFIAQLGDVLIIVSPLVAALVGGGVLSHAGSRVGQSVSDQLPANVVRVANLFSAALAGASVSAILGAGVDWFYQIDDLQKTLWLPGGVGAALGLLLSVRSAPKDPLPIGSVVYYLTRTVLNATRSIEPLVMVIVFVVWVGIGPFAGSLALALHTIAALAKLYSEQVESILSGPLEAIRATGANRLQTIVYAVIPQIIPPYISFTMYRWDINVRMSTIIGFAGGGGIGFLLQQNINMLQYRAASVQMLAIAIVVASMDYVSAVIRERFV